MATMQKRKVLIAECEPDFIGIAEGALQDGYEVSVAGSRKEGLEEAKRSSPDLAIIGYLEPRGDSFKLHEDLRECFVTRHIPLLVVDVSPEEHARKGWRRFEGTRMNAEAYLTRPLECAELREEVERVLETVAAEAIDSKEVLEQIDSVLKRVERIEKALGSQMLGEQAKRNAVQAPGAQPGA